jgi:hypothetical protein
VFLVAGDIEEVIKGFDEGDVLKRSGQRDGRYVEPAVAVGDILTEAMDPFFDRLRKHLEKANHVAALALCKAIVLGMYRFIKTENHPLLYFCRRYPEETADWAVCLWRAKGDVDKADEGRFDSQRKFPADFAKRYTPEWTWLLDES